MGIPGKAPSRAGTLLRVHVLRIDRLALLRTNRRLTTHAITIPPRSSATERDRHSR